MGKKKLRKERGKKEEKKKKYQGKITENQE